MTSKSRHPLYQVWKGMRARCNNPNHISYHLYGAKGIQVCERWDDFWLFLEDMGERPDNHYQIDRVDSDGDYEPSNCEWVTHRENCRDWHGKPMNFHIKDDPMRYIFERNGHWVLQIHLGYGKKVYKTFDVLEDAIALRSDIEMEREMHKRLGF